MLARGFTLIELMIGLAIFGFLALLALPMYGEFLANSQVRTAAESILSGVRLAQTEAVRRSVPVRFELVGNNKWQVVFHSDEKRMPNCGATTNCTSDNRIMGGATCDADSECTISSKDFLEGADKATATKTGGSAVTFSSLGLPQATNNDASAPLEMVAVTTLATSNPRELHIVIGGLTSSAGGTKLCDPTFASTDPMGCPS